MRVGSGRPDLRIRGLGITILALDDVIGLLFMPLGRIGAVWQGVLLLTEIGLTGISAGTFAVVDGCTSHVGGSRCQIFRILDPSPAMFSSALLYINPALLAMDKMTSINKQGGER